MVFCKFVEQCAICCFYSQRDTLPSDDSTVGEQHTRHLIIHLVSCCCQQAMQQALTSERQAATAATNAVAPLTSLASSTVSACHATVTHAITVTHATATCNNRHSCNSHMQQLHFSKVTIKSSRLTLSLSSQESSCSVSSARRSLVSQLTKKAP